MELIFHNNVDRAYREISKWMDQYVSRLSSTNRFLCSLGRIRQRFPEYDDETLSRVWQRLQAQGRVKLDPMDGEWIVAKG